MADDTKNINVKNVREIFNDFPTVKKYSTDNLERKILREQLKKAKHGNHTKRGRRSKQENNEKVNAILEEIRKTKAQDSTERT